MGHLLPRRFGLWCVTVTMVRFGQLALLLTGGFCFATFLLLGNRLTHIASSSLTTTLTLAPDAACPLPTVAAATIAVANCSAAVENGRQALAEVSCPAQSIGSGSSSSSYIPFHPFYDLNRSRLSVFDELAGWYLRPWTPLSGRPAFVSQRMLDVMEVTYRTEAFRFRIVGRQLLYRHTAWWPQTYRLDRMNWWLVLLQQLIDEGRVTDGVDALFSMSDGPRVGSDTMFQTSKGAAAFPLFTMRTSVTHVDIPLVDSVVFGSNGRYVWDEKAKRVPWEEKLSKAVFRGSASCFVMHADNWHICPRVKAVQVGQQHPDLLDIGLTRWNQAGKGTVMVQMYPPSTEAEIESSTNVTLVPPMKWMEQGHYKYILDMDGGVGSSRKPVRTERHIRAHTRTCR